MRQGHVVDDSLCPQGKRALQLVALQALPVDGKEMSELSLSFNIRGIDVRPGENCSQLPRVEICFFDEKHRFVGGDWTGGWNMTFDWIKKERLFAVEPWRRYWRDAV